MAIKLSPEAERCEVTKGQHKLVLSFLNRLSSGNTALDDICPVRSMPGVYRWKPDASIRRTSEENEIRVLYRYEHNDIVVVAVAERDENTYLDGWKKRRRNVTR